MRVQADPVVDLNSLHFGFFNFLFLFCYVFDNRFILVLAVVGLSLGPFLYCLYFSFLIRDVLRTLSVEIYRERRRECRVLVSERSR